MEASRPSLGEVVFGLWAIAVFLNAIEAFVDPDGELWDASRLGLGGFCVLLFAVWVGQRFIRWRRGRA
jgi:hypothetical protein